MDTATYDAVNALPEFGMIGGESRVITFTVTDEDGVNVDVTAGSASWVLAYYGDPSYKVLEVAGVMSGTPNNEFTVTLTQSHTENLSGKFIQQVTFTAFGGKEYRKQGFVTIVQRID